MIQSRLYTTFGQPTLALRQAFRVSNTSSVPELVMWLAADISRLEKLAYQRGAGPAFINVLMSYVADPSAIPADLLPRVIKTSHGQRYTYTRRHHQAVGRAYTARRITLQHITTGKQRTFPSIAAAARTLRWGTNGTFHFDNVLKGNRLAHRGWGIPGILNEKLALKDVLGNTYEETVAQVASKVGSIAANKLRRGQPYQALVPVGHDLSAAIPPRAFNYTGFTFRVGYKRGRGSPLVRVDHLNEAPEKLGISVPSAYQLVHGLRSSVRGVTLRAVYTEPRRIVTALQPVTP